MNCSTFEALVCPIAVDAPRESPPGKYTLSPFIETSPPRRETLSPAGPRSRDATPSRDAS